MRRSVKVAGGVALLSVLSTTPASAQRLPVQAGRWNIDYGNVRCSLSRRIGGPQSPVLTVTSYLGEDNPELFLLRDGSEAPPSLPAQVDVVLLPGNAVVHAQTRTRRTQTGSVTGVAGLGAGFIERFGASNGVRLLARGRILLDVSTPTAASAVTALKTCNDDLLRSWGVDPAAQLSREARRVSGSITSADYPAEVLNARASGATVTRFTVGTDGRVTSCNVTVSSGNALLDRQSCGAIQLRFRYEPALDMQGQPVASIKVQTITWRLSGE